MCIVPTIIMWNNIHLIREYSALQEVINKFSYVFLPEHVDRCATCARSILKSSISSHFEHICWAHILFGTKRKISITLLRTLRALCIKQNVHKSVWKLARLERSDIANTYWWLLIVTDIAESLEKFKLRIWSHKKLQFLHTRLHSQTILLSLSLSDNFGNSCH